MSYHDMKNLEKQIKNFHEILNYLLKQTQNKKNSAKEIEELQVLIDACRSTLQAVNSVLQ